MHALHMSSVLLLNIFSLMLTIDYFLAPGLTSNVYFNSTEQDLCLTQYDIVHFQYHKKKPLCYTHIVTSLNILLNNCHIDQL